MKIFTTFLVIILTLFTSPLLFAFELTYHHDESGQRRDGSKLFDIVYELTDLGSGDTVYVFVYAITQSGETLAFSTPDSTWGTFSGDTVCVVGPGVYRIVWDIGADQPNREFYSDSVGIYITVGLPGFTPGPCGTAIMVAAGGVHTVALKSDGTVWTWGRNGWGQLGDGTRTDRHTPVQVVGPGGMGYLTDVIAVAAGDIYTVALKSDGTVWTWGENCYGQLGNGNSGGTSGYYDPGIDSNTPVQVVGPGGTGYLTDVIAVAAGMWHTVAFKSDGTVWTWGWNEYGQLGDGTTTNSNTPVQVLGPGGSGFLTDVIAVAAGWGHTVALKSDGTVWTWGCNSYGELGDGTTTDTPTPVQVTGPGGTGYLSDVIAIAAGDEYTVALKSDGTVWTWGYNDFGELGDGTTTNSPVPVQVVGPGGSGSLTDVIAVATGWHHTVALKSDGTVWTWGRNNYGQLGDGTTTDSSTPVQVVGPGGTGYLSDVIAIAAGRWHTVAVKSDGTIWTWGENYYGQLGDGTTTDSPTPVQALLP